MQLEERKVGDVTVIVVSGDITQHKGGDLVLKNRVREVLQQGQKKLILDLAGVSYVDSAGLGEMVQAYATTKKEGGMLKLVAVTARLRDLLTITKLVTVFDSYDSQADAVASFTPSA
jgi:anti-sigma B factor antagonist